MAQKNQIPRRPANMSKNPAQRQARPSRSPAAKPAARGNGNGNGRAAYERKDNSGALFQNDRKEKETHPDYRGQAKIGGVDYWLSGWKKVSAAGQTYLSLSLQVKEVQTEEKGGDQADGGQDDIPF